MHDRVHHAMHKATVYDRVSRARDADLDNYVGEDRAPYPPGETVLRRDQVNTDFLSMEGFREFVWQEEFEDRHFHAAMQAMMAFDEMLYTLMTDWAVHGAGKADAACGPPAVGPRVSPGAVAPGFPRRRWPPGFPRRRWPPGFPRGRWPPGFPRTRGMRTRTGWPGAATPSGGTWSRSRPSCTTASTT
jgi:hypothetical protein